MAKEDLGMDRVLQELEMRNREQLRSLENVPYRADVIGRGELRRLAEMQAALSRLIQELAGDVSTLPADKLRKIESFLDSQRLWAHKFRTETSGGAAEGALVFDDAINSVYYLTPSNVSLRIRKVALSEGKAFHRAIQPLAEMAFFEEPKTRKISLEPRLGYTVKEAFTGQIQKADTDNDLNISMNIYEQNGELRGVLPTSDKFDFHSGDRVNKIIY